MSPPSVKFTLHGSISVLLPLLLAHAACVETDEPLELGSDEQSIVGSNVVDSDEYKAVVFVNVPGTGSCSGTFIHPRYVLTAAHCLPRCGNGLASGCIALGAPGVSGTWVGIDGPSNATFNDGVDGGSGTGFVADKVFFPTAADFGNTTPPDVALLHVSSFYRRNVIRAAPWFQFPTKDSTGSWAGRVVEVLGYSRNGGLNPVERRRGTMKIHGNTVDRWFALDSYPSYTCFGDSGGPALVRDASMKLQLVGLHSLVQCRDVGEQVAMESFLPRQLLERTAGADPLCNGLSWDLCVASLPPAAPPTAPVATVAWSPEGVAIKWTDAFPAGTVKVRITRSPAFPGGPVEQAVIPSENRTFLDRWSSTTVSTTTMSYSLCAVNTFREEACATVVYTPPVALAPTELSATSNDSIDRLFLHFRTVNNGGAQSTVRIYRNGVSDYRTAQLGQTVDLVDTLNVYAYTRYTYRVCTVSYAGVEVCGTATADTYGGLPQCPSGYVACDGVCKRVWQCPHPQ